MLRFFFRERERERELDPAGWELPEGGSPPQRPPVVSFRKKGQAEAWKTKHPKTFFLKKNFEKGQIGWPLAGLSVNR